MNTQEGFFKAVDRIAIQRDLALINDIRDNWGIARIIDPRNWRVLVLFKWRIEIGGMAMTLFSSKADAKYVENAPLGAPMPFSRIDSLLDHIADYLRIEDRDPVTMPDYYRQAAREWEAGDELLGEAVGNWLYGIGHLEACSWTLKATTKEMFLHAKALSDKDSREEERKKCGDEFWTGEWRREQIDEMVFVLNSDLPVLAPHPLADKEPEVGTVFAVDIEGDLCDLEEVKEFVAEASDRERTRDLWHAAGHPLSLDEFEAEILGLVDCKVMPKEGFTFGWCWTHGEPENAGHAFANKRVATLD